MFPSQRSLRERCPIPRALASFIFQRPRYTNPLPGFPAGPILKEMSVSRAFYTYLSGSPVMKSPVQVPLTELPQRETLHP